MVYRYVDDYLHQTDGLLALFKLKINIILKFFLSNTYIHAYTSNLRPTVSFSFIFKISSTSFKYRFINSTTTSNNACKIFITNYKCCVKKSYYLVFEYFNNFIIFSDNVYFLSHDYS